MAKSKTKRSAKNPSWRRSVKTVKKVRRRLGITDWKAPLDSKRKHKAAKAKSRKAKPAKRNPPKLRALKGSTGWMRADAVRVVKKAGKTVLLIRKPRKR